MPCNDELLPLRQSTRASTDHYTSLRVHKLGPVKRWLRQQAGRPWNAVYSDLCSAFDKRNGAQAYVLTRAIAQVELHNVYFSDEGRARVSTAYGYWDVDGLYVHPRTRTLCYQELDRLSAARRREKHEARKPVEIVQVSPNLQLRKLKDLWYWIDLAPVTAPSFVQVPERELSDGTVLPGYSVLDRCSVCRDVLTGREFLSPTLNGLTQRALQHDYGRPDHYARGKRQASHKDVCRYVPEQRLVA